jgi:hypothetical protein
MLVMVAFGVGEILGALACGQVIDKAGSKVASILNVMCVIIATGFGMGYLL